MTNDICEKIENDEFFKIFLVENKSETPASKTVLSYTDQINRLSEGLETLSNELQAQVREQHGALLSQASHAGKLENAIELVYDRVQSIQKQADRIKSQVVGPYMALKTQIQVLERLHQASHILRQAGRFLLLYRKLQSTKDLIEQAGIITELEPLMTDKDLDRIDFLKEEIATSISTKQKLISVATIDLNNGLKNKNVAKIDNGLKILTNLNRISDAIDEWHDTFINDIRQSIKECFSGVDVIGGGTQKSTTKSGSKAPGKLPTLSTSQNFRQKLWTSIEWLFGEEIFGICQQVILLQTCIDKLDSQLNPIQSRFWTELEKLLETSFRECPQHIGQCLQQSLPKLLAQTQGLQSKLEKNLAFSETTFKSLEVGYLEKCGTTLKASLVGTDCPTQDSVDLLLRAASIELSAAMVDDNLCMLVAGVFSAVSKDFFTKIESYVKLGTDSQQVLDIPNASQIQNTLLANTLFYHLSLSRRMIINMGNNFSKAAAEQILTTLNDGERLILIILQQLIDSILSALNIILLSMHREPGLNSGTIQSSGPSLYMKEFQEFLQRAWISHISPFNDTSSVEQCGKELAKNCIELFVQNLAIVRPLSQAGRYRLKSDCLHLETALKPICKDLSALGRPYRMLRAFSAIIVMSPEKIIEDNSEMEGPINQYLILLLLFGYGSADLTSPQTAAGWSNEKFIQWLNGHTSERERLEMITGAVQKYRAYIRQKNLSQYDNVYPLISNYLETALTYYK